MHLRFNEQYLRRRWNPWPSWCFQNSCNAIDSSRMQCFSNYRPSSRPLPGGRHVYRSLSSGSNYSCALSELASVLLTIHYLCVRRTWMRKRTGMWVILTRIRSMWYRSNLFCTNWRGAFGRHHAKTSLRCNVNVLQIYCAWSAKRCQNIVHSAIYNYC